MKLYFTILKPFKKISVKLLSTILTLISLVLSRCESNDRYYRPHTPEKLSAIGIIDAYDTTRYIIFEKSYQAEYPEETIDSLRELSFTISNSSGILYSFQADYALENKTLLKLPESLIFISGEKYYFRAKERDCPEITSEITIPDPPSGLELLTVSREIITDYARECTEGHDDYKPWLDVISISFDNNKNKDSYYALMVESYGLNDIGSWVFGYVGESYMEFSLRQSNTQGFFSMFPGLTRYTFDPCNDYMLIKNSAHAYYMRIDKSQDNKSTLVITIQSHDIKTIPAFPDYYRIRLLAIPDEMYLFNKSLYTYERNTGDPFSEPVCLQGNIKGGYGMFAICRSLELQIKAPSINIKIL